MSKSGRPSSYGQELKEAALKEFRESDLNDLEICAKYDINIGTFKWWCSEDPDLSKLLRVKRRAHVKKYMFMPEERITAVEAFLKSEMNLRDFAKVYGVSSSTLSSWRNIYEALGPEALATSKIRNYPRGRKSISDNLKNEITTVKKENPTFGLRKVRDFLMRFKGVKVSHKTVGKTLKENNIPNLQVSRKRRHGKSKIRRFERAKPMQLWQSDITSYMLTRHSQRVYLTVFMDDHSRYIVAWNLQLRQTNDLVIDSLLHGIQNFGKPEEVLTDQGRQYFAWRGKSDFKKTLDKQGIRHVVSRSHHPQTLGKCERFWETVKQELWERAKPQELGEARERLKHFINHYNHFRPHQGLEGMTPADRFFGVESEIRKKIEETVKENELRLALGELPRVPVFLVGQIGNQSISLHGENGQLVINTPDGKTQSIEYEKFGHTMKENADGTGAIKKAWAQTREFFKNTTGGNTSEGSVATSDGGGKKSSTANRDTSDGVLDGANKQDGFITSDQCSTDQNLAVVTAGDLGNASWGIEAAKNDAEGSNFDGRRESEETKEEDRRARETHSDAGSVDCDIAKHAGSQGSESGATGASSDSGSEESWSSKEKRDTDGSSS